jgi:glycosyltransferase involved in cell wall biosynthesis
VTAVALVIPAWDEAESIAAVLAEIPRAAIDHVFVVVPHANDPTAVVARDQATVLVQHQPGYGAACWTGAQAALERNADIIAFLDGDYSDPPSALPSLMAPIAQQTADLVLACRNLSKHPEALPVHARLGNALVTTVIRALTGQSLTDLPSQKAISAKALEALDMREMTYGWTVEMLVKSARAGLRIEQIPVHYRPRLAGRSKVAGSLTGSLKAAHKLLTCAVAYATWRRSSGPAVSVLSGR